jgi:ABC-type glycerol-3-phosphate transport system permease component
MSGGKGERSYAPVPTLRPGSPDTLAQAIDRLGRQRVRRALWAGLIVLLLLIAAALFLLPFYWLFITAVKPVDQVFTTPLVLWPRELLWSNFYDVWLKAPFPRYFANTAFIAVLNILGHGFAATLVGYGFAVARFRGRDFLFVVLLATMMIPQQITLIPLFVFFKYLNWIDTFLPLTVPPFFGVGSAFYIFLMRQFFLTIPIELDEAARIDGASTLRILWSIYVPLSVPALMTIAIFSFVHAWNDFFGPLIFLLHRENWTLTLGLAALSNPQFSDYREVMAAGLLVSLPCILVFFLAQRVFTEGITLTGIKG